MVVRCWSSRAYCRWDCWPGKCLVLLALALGAGHACCSQPRPDQDIPVAISLHPLVAAIRIVGVRANAPHPFCCPFGHNRDAAIALHNRAPRDRTTLLDGDPSSCGLPDGTNQKVPVVRSRRAVGHLLPGLMALVPNRHGHRYSIRATPIPSAVLSIDFHVLVDLKQGFFFLSFGRICSCTHICISSSRFLTLLLIDAASSPSLPSSKHSNPMCTSASAFHTKTFAQSYHCPGCHVFTHRRAIYLCQTRAFIRNFPSSLKNLQTPTDQAHPLY